MGLINLGHNYKADVEKARQRDKTLEETKDRFKYPKGPDISDMVGTLLPVRWDDIYFPCSEFTTDVSQAIVEHKYPNRDSARLEAMGREPLLMKATAVFVNTIVPGPTDNWKQGDLFPNTYNKMLLSSFSGDTKVLNHPTIGEIKCKILSFSPTIDARFRGGVVVNITWKETIAADDLEATTESLKNQIASAKQSAAALDNMMPTLNPSPSDLGIPEYKDSLLDTINKITTLLAAPGMFVGQIISSIDSLEGRCHLIIDKIHAAYTTAWGQANALAYKLKADAKTFRDTARMLKGQNGTASRLTATYMTERKHAFTNLCSLLHNTYNDLASLNPTLLASPTVPSGTAVLYYTS